MKRSRVGRLLADDVPLTDRADQGEAGVISLSPVSPTISPRYTIAEIIQHAGNDREVLAEQIRLQSMVIESLQEKLDGK
jgi:hypothetical protein